MNKEYIYYDGNIILEEENGNRKPIEYRNNLDEILIQENVIETMENEKNELERKSEKFNKNRKLYKWDVLFPLFAGMSVPIGVSLILNCFGVFAVEPFSLAMNTGFSSITGGQFFIGGMSSIFVGCGGIFSLFNYAEYKNKVKKEKARKASIEYLNGALEKAKEDLNEMKKQKAEENNKKGFRIVKINDSEEIRKIYDHINLYYDLGYNGYKYYRYYQKHNKLPKKLENNYTELGKEHIKEYLEEKGPSLVKKRA